MEDVYKTTDKTNRHNEDGHEILNPTPMQPPLNYKAQPSLAEQIRQQVRAHVALLDMEPETEEEADDFEIDDDPQPVSRWENDMVPSIKETRKRIRELEEQQKLYAVAPTTTNQERPRPEVGEEPSTPRDLTDTPKT